MLSDPPGSLDGKTSDRSLESDGHNNVGILAFGSLLWEPGQFIEDNKVRLVRVDTPFEVEYARSSKKRGGGPTLIPDDRGGQVNGGIWVLRLTDNRSNLSIVKRELAKREQTAESNIIESPGLGGLSHVFYVALQCNIPEIGPDVLATKAIDSVRSPQKNGIQYLMKNIESGILTPLTNDYGNAILLRLHCQNLEETEAEALRGA